MHTSSSPSSILARGAIFIPPPYNGVLANAANREGRLLRVAQDAFSPLLSADVRTFICSAEKVKTVGARLSRYPPCPRSQRGRRLARLATSPSRPTPATQQKYRVPRGMELL